jgi:pimeloyl-ACP methyl ester carboxylesterase
MSVEILNSPEESSETLLPEWHEALFGVDLALLLSSPVYYGVGVPHGDGSAVLVIPGFMHGDTYLLLMNAWLRRLGYRPYYSRIGFNASCPNLLIKDILDPTIKDILRETRGKVHLIGHSLGGTIARSIAVQRPREIASVITLGSPIRQTRVHPTMFRDAEAVRKYVVEHTPNVHAECMTSSCTCDYMSSLWMSVPKTIRFTAIFTRNDGSVDWHSCRTGDPAVDVEVPGTHTGSVFNATAYSVIAQRLAAK